MASARPLRHLPLTGALALALAAPAQAAPVAASADDPRDGIGGAARDIEQVRSTFDAETGRWTVTTRFWGPVSDTQWAMINAALYRPGTSRESCTAGATTVATLRASTKPSSTTAFGQAGAYDDPPNPDGSQGLTAMDSIGRTTSTDRREVTIEGVSSRLVGRSVACVTLTLSYRNEIQDRLNPPAWFPLAAAQSPDGGSGGGTGGAGGGTTGPATLSLRLTSARLRARPRRTVSAALRPLDRSLTGTTRLRTRGTRPRVLATGTWRAIAGRRVALRLRLSVAGSRWARRHPRARVRLTVAAHVPAAAAVSRTFTVRLPAGRA